jgi:hypothetical protein
VKKLLLALALLLLPAAAHATVSCSVPFNLTNGTTADATQVMANYNAILACLSSGAASSGSNSDITSLNGLTTPITPAQGGAAALCGALGYKAVNDVTFPLSSLHITFLQVVATSTTNALQFGASGNLTLNFSTNGVDGLDTGTLAASSVYYIWLIGNGTAIHSLASLSSTAPTMPGGYTFKCRVSAIPTNAVPNLYQILTLGFLTVITESVGSTPFAISPVTGNCNTFTFTSQVFALLPATATQAQGYVLGVGATQAGVARSITGGQYALYFGVAGLTLELFYNGLLVAPQTLFYCSSSANNSLVVNGWVDNTNVH